MPRLRTPYLWPEIVFELRCRASTTQAELASSLGCCVSTISKWERGETKPVARAQRALDQLGRRLSYPREAWPRRLEQRKLFFHADAP